MESLPYDDGGGRGLPSTAILPDEYTDKIIQEQTSGGTYRVDGGKEVANAALISKKFLERATDENPVGTTILDIGKNDKQAWARVAAFRGPKSQPLAWVEDQVIIDYETVWDKLVWDAVDRGIWIYDQRAGKRVKVQVQHEMKGLKIIPTDKAVQMHLIRAFIQKKHFSERDALTHARERAQRQLLGFDWREKEEQQQEIEEAESVQEMREQSGAAISLDEVIAWGSWKGATWRQAAADAGGRQELQRIEREARAKKYADVARAALAWWAGQEKSASAAPQPEEQAATKPPNGATAEAKPKRGRPKKEPETESQQQPKTAQPATAATEAAAPKTPEPAPQPAASTEPPKSEHGKSLYEDIINTIGDWPGADLDEYIEVYSASVALFPQYKDRGLDKVPLADADEESVRKVHNHVMTANRIWKLALEKHGGDKTNAKGWLDEKAVAAGKKGFFDPQVGRLLLDSISEAVIAFQSSLR